MDKLVWSLIIETYKYKRKPRHTSAERGRGQLKTAKYIAKGSIEKKEMLLKE